MCLQLSVQDGLLHLCPDLCVTVKPSHCDLVLGVPIFLGCYKDVWSALIAKTYGTSLFNKKHEASDIPAGKLRHLAIYIVTASSPLGFCFPSLLKYLHCTLYWKH